MLYIWAERLGVLIARVALTNAVRVLQSFAVIVHDGSTADLGLLTVELMRYR